VSRDFKRTSVAGTLQFEPTDRFQITADAYYSDFQDQGIFRGVETPLAQWGGVGTPTVNGTGVFADSATYDNVGPILRTDTEGNTAEIFSFGLNTSYAITDRLTATIDFSTSSLEKDDVDYESYAGTGSRIFRGVDWSTGGFLPARDPSLLDTLTYTFPSDGEYSINAGLDYTDPNRIVLADPGGWGQVGFIKEPHIEDDLQQIRAEAEYELDKGFIESVVVGGLMTDREKSFDSRENFIRVGNGFQNDEAALPASAVLGSTDTGSIGLDIVAYDPSSLLTDGTYRLEAANSVTWSVEEDITTLYGMANLNFDMGIPVTGNIGVQYVDVEQSSTAGSIFVTDSYEDWLPSLNLSAEIMDDTFLRFSGSRTVTRPRMDQMRAGSEPSFNATICPDGNSDGNPDSYLGSASPTPGMTCVSIGGGNPLLRPYESTGFDLALEHYFSNAGAISVAVFTKDIEDYVQDTSSLVEGGNVVGALYGNSFVTQNPGTEFITVFGPANVENAKLEGFEFAARVPFEDFVPALEGFGANFAYTYTDSDLTFNGQNVPIPGYSKETMSGEIYYEKDGFRARVNGRHRSSFLSEIQNFDGSLSGADATSETILDAQIGYEFQSGSLEGFSINLEAYNLTDEPFRTRNDLDGPGGSGTDTWISRHELYGTTYNITLAKKF